MQYGRYRIVKELGKGNMGVVYQAHDPQIDRPVALKVLRPDRVVSEAFVTRFMKEARAIGRLSHPNIVTVYDVGEDNNAIYIAMEFLQGEPFNEVIRSGRLTVPQSIAIGKQMAEALDYAHGKGIVHRDIKPSNMILSAENQAKLTDFGIARIEDPAASAQTQVGEILGTPIYMSPEQVMGQAADGRADLYSLGVILYEMTTGRRPFTGNSIAAIFRAITQDTAEPPSAINPFVPQKLSDLIMKCLAKTPQERFQSGRELAAALDVITAALSRVDQGDPSEPVKKKRPLMIPVFVLLAVIVTLGAYQFMARRGTIDSSNPTAIRGQGAGAQTTPTLPNPATNGVVATPTAPESSPMRLPALLTVNTQPPAAQVYVDNIYRGKTPLELELPLGKYELRVNLPEHLEWEGQIELDIPGPTTFNVPTLRRLQ
jgi:serine/threonine-protein kinase